VVVTAGALVHGGCDLDGVVFRVGGFGRVILRPRLGKAVSNFPGPFDSASELEKTLGGNLGRGVGRRSTGCFQSAAFTGLGLAQFADGLAVGAGIVCRSG